MKALVTGVTGFAGSHLAEHLLACGDVVLGTSTSGHWRHPPPSALVDRVPLLAWDITGDPDDGVRRELDDFQPDWVFHLAAMAIPQQCGDASPDGRAWQVNVEGTRRVMALVSRWAGTPGLLLASSSHVYAPVAPATPRVREDAAVGPQIGYARTKLAAELVVREVAAARNLTALIARTFHHAGPRQDPQLMLAEWCRQLAAGKRPLQVYNCDSFLDLSDVRDVVRAYRMLALHVRQQEGPVVETVNVGSGVCYRSGALLDHLLGLLDQPWEYQELHPGRRQHPIADIGRLQRLTGWEPSVPIERTLADCLEYWRQVDRTP